MSLQTLMESLKPMIYQDSNERPNLKNFSLYD